MRARIGPWHGRGAANGGSGQNPQKRGLMKIKKREVNDVVVLDVSGEMYGGPENMKLREMAKELL